MAQTYRVFVRNWWRYEYTPFGTRWGMRATARTLVPDPGARKTTIAIKCTEEEARAMCEAYAQNHKPGPLSRKAEYERER